MDLLTKIIVIGALAALSLATASPAFAACYMDTPSGYGGMGGAERIGPYASSSECESVNRQYFSGRGRCSCSSEGGSGGVAPPGGGDPQLLMMQMFMQFGFDLLGKQMECTFNPNCDTNVQQRELEEQQRQLQEEERRQREAAQRAAEDERKRKEAERRARFEASREKLLGEMRLQPGSGDLRPRHLGLETRETAGGLQARTLAPRELGASPTVGAASLRAPLARASCGAYLLRKADEAAVRGDLQEASFLSSDAAGLMSGEKVTTAVECPPPPAVPEIGEGVVIETEENRRFREEFEQSLRQRSTFMSTMYRRVADQGVEYRQAEEELRQAEARKEQAETELAQARAARERLEAEQAVAPAAATPRPPAPAAADQKSAMAEALAAMEAAEAAYADAEGDLQSSRERKAEIEKQVEETRSLFNDAKKEPAGMERALKKMGADKE